MNWVHLFREQQEPESHERWFATGLEEDFTIHAYKEERHVQKSPIRLKNGITEGDLWKVVEVDPMAEVQKNFHKSTF